MPKKRGTKPKTRSTSRRSRSSGSRTIPAAEFKARCLELMDRVRQQRRSIVVTKHGRPVVRVIPYDDEPPAILGALRGTVTYYGDIVSPIDVDWEADAS